MEERKLAAKEPNREGGVKDIPPIFEERPFPENPWFKPDPEPAPHPHSDPSTDEPPQKPFWVDDGKKK